MKKIYVKPELQVVQMHYSQMLCDSVMAPGGDNRPAAAPEFDEWDDELLDEWDDKLLDV